MHERGESRQRQNPREPGHVEDVDNNLARRDPTGCRPTPEAKPSSRPVLEAPFTVHVTHNEKGDGVAIANSGDCGRREASRLWPGQALKGEPRERTSLKGYEGGRRGSKAPRRMVSARAQLDPGR